MDLDSITLAQLEEDPYPVMAEMREHTPVGFVPSLDMWFVARWDDVRYVIDHPELFTAGTEPSWLREVLGPNMLACDGAEQRRLKEAFQPPFTPSVVGGWVTDRLPELCDELIDAFPAGPVDLMAAYAEPIAVIALRDALGWHAPWQDIARWTRGVCAGLANFENDPERAAVARIAHDESARSLAAQLASGDLTRGLAHLVGVGMSTEEILGNVRLCMSGGINEPRDGIALVAWALLTHPAELAACHAEPGRWRAATEELFRWIAPVATATRQTTAEVTLGGVEIPAGAMVAALISSANRDERRYPTGHLYRPDRRDGPHLAFSDGPHVCLGAWLGRSTVRVAVEHLFTRLPGLRLVDPAGVQIRGFEFRGPLDLLVET